MHLLCPYLIEDKLCPIIVLNFLLLSSTPVLLINVCLILNFHSWLFSQYQPRKWVGRVPPFLQRTRESELLELVTRLGSLALDPSPAHSSRNPWVLAAPALALCTLSIASFFTGFSQIKMHTRHTKTQRLTSGPPRRYHLEKGSGNELIKGLESDNHGFDSHTKLDK